MSRDAQERLRMTGENCPSNRVGAICSTRTGPLYGCLHQVATTFFVKLNYVNDIDRKSSWDPSYIAVIF